jgi:hypothetical protein
MAWLGVFAAALWMALAGVLPAYGAKRVALVIGNSNYQNPELALKNPTNDATGLAEALRTLGFELLETQFLC